VSALSLTPFGFGPLSLEADRSGTRDLPLWIVILVVAAYVLPGLVGHDPWKQDEAYVFGGVLDMLKDGDWIVVKVGGVPFMEKPPLYHWMAVLTARIFSPWLPMHDAASLASGVFVAIAVAAVASAAQLLWGRGHGRVGALMMLSALGLLTNAQMMLTDLPLMAGFALAVAGFAGCRQSRAWGAVVLGIGVGVGFLGKGIFAPAAIGAAALALPLVFDEYRTRRYSRDLAVAFAVALPLVVVWPAALWARSPELFMTWFWDNNIGRYLGFSVPYLGAKTQSGFWLATWPWFLFPLWIFAAALAIRDGAGLLKRPAAQIGLVLGACIAAVLATSASARAIYALPMIPPLALVAAGCAGAVGARLNRWLFVLAIAFACAVAAIVWYGWASLVLTGEAPDWPWLTQYFPVPFSLQVEPAAVALAAALTLGFAAACVALRAATQRGIAIWVAAIALGWGLVASLWFPWIDHAKSYRGVYESLAATIPAHVDCVASLEIGESERAVLEYVLGIPTYDAANLCMAVLRQRRADRVAPLVPKSWRLLWTGARPGDYRDRFELWLRERPVSRTASVNSGA
jgi:4-amino-4-deoxy-L-arabinose transferase-like glycosyltransferase